MSKSLKSIGVLSFLTVVSRLLALVRDSVQLAIFGAGEVMSAFTTANIAPNLFRRLLAEGSMTAAFIPTLQHELHEHGKEGTFRLLSKVASWLLVITGWPSPSRRWRCSATCAHLAPELDAKWYIAADLAVILFPYLALVSLAAAFSATLNVLEHFVEPALSPIWLNLAILATLAGAGSITRARPVSAIHWLCAGVLGGGFMQMACPAGVLGRTMGWKPRFDLGLSPQVREIARLMTPGIFGTAIYQINFSVSRFLAFSLDDASATYLYAVNRLMEFPIGVFAVAVSTVVYPLIARHAVKGDTASMAAEFQKGIRLILIINVPAAAGLAVLSAPIVDLIFRHGLVTHDAAQRMGLLLAVMAIGLPFFSVVSLMVRAFYAMKDTATPVRIALVDFVINIVGEPRPDPLVRPLRHRPREHGGDHRPDRAAGAGPCAAHARAPPWPAAPERGEDPRRRRGDGGGRPRGTARRCGAGAAHARLRPGRGRRTHSGRRRRLRAVALDAEDRGRRDELRASSCKVPVLGRIFRAAL